MKKILMTLMLTTLVTTSVFAIPPFSFLGMHLGISEKKFIKTIESRGFDNLYGDGYHGNFLGFRGKLTAHKTIYSKKIVDIKFSPTLSNDGNSAKELYRYYLDIYKEKYGEPKVIESTWNTETVNWFYPDEKAEEPEIIEISYKIGSENDMYIKYRSQQLFNLSCQEAKNDF